MGLCRPSHRFVKWWWCTFPAYVEGTLSPLPTVVRAIRPHQKLSRKVHFLTDWVRGETGRQEVRRIGSQEVRSRWEDGGRQEERKLTRQVVSQVEIKVRLFISHVLNTRGNKLIRLLQVVRKTGSQEDNKSGRQEIKKIWSCKDSKSGNMKSGR